jgi:branched-chain amino acid transport system substrate-binding protein
LTGAQAALGRDARAAADFALAAWKSARRDRAPPAITLELRDDACATGAAAEAAVRHIIADAEALATRPPAVVVGHPCRSTAEIAGPLYARAGLIFITTSQPSSAPGARMAARPGLLHFEMTAASPGQGGFIGATLAALPPEARIALVTDPTHIMQTMSREAAQALANAGRVPVEFLTFPSGTRDFSRLAAVLAEAEATHVGLFAYPAEGGLLLGELAKLRPNAQAIATDAFEPALRSMRASSSQPAALAVSIALRPDAAAFAWTAPLVAHWRAQVAGQPPRAALATHAAVEALLSLAEPGSGLAADPARLAAALTAAPAPTILGPLQFDGRGAATLPPWLLYVWRDGALVPR